MADLLPVVGIDISKATFDAHWGIDKGKQWQARFSNDAQGCAQLHDWILRHDVTQAHCCLEATATYSDAVATFCFAQGHHVSIIAPHKLHAFRTTEGVLSKTDQIDARLLACYGAQKRPLAWHPVSGAAQQLKRDLDRLDELKAMRQQEKNRLENQRLDTQAREHIETHITWLKDEETSWRLLVEERFAHAWGQEQEPSVPQEQTPQKQRKPSRKPPMHIAPIDALMQVSGIGRLYCSVNLHCACGDARGCAP